MNASAILLAAGESRRMGDRNKLLLPVDGEPLVRRTARVLLASSVSHLVVVLGHEQEQVAGALADLPLRTVVNLDYAAGQMSSVHCGLSALHARDEAVLIALADQPLLEAWDIDLLLKAFAERSRGAVLVPTFDGRRGNPIVLAADQCDAILQGGRNLGCRHLIDRNPDLVTTLEFPNDHVVADLDTPAEYAALRSCA